MCKAHFDETVLGDGCCSVCVPVCSTVPTYSMMWLYCTCVGKRKRSAREKSVEHGGDPLLANLSLADTSQPQVQGYSSGSGSVILFDPLQGSSRGSQISGSREKNSSTQKVFFILCYTDSTATPAFDCTTQRRDWAHVNFSVYPGRQCCGAEIIYFRRQFQSYHILPLKPSVVDPDPHGSGTFAWIRIRNYCSGSGSSKIWKSR